MAGTNLAPASPPTLLSFGQIVAGMLSADNNVRSTAEKQYEEIPLQQKGGQLFQLYTNSTVAGDVRSMALVLLRRILNSHYEEFWKAFNSCDSNAVKQEFQAQLLKCMVEENDVVLKKRLIDVVAELARNSIDDDSGKQQWAEVLQLLEQFSLSQDAKQREAAMTLIESVPNIFGADQRNYMNGIKQMFQSSLLYNAESSVRTAAVRALVAFVCENEEDDSVIRSLSDLVPAVIKVCQHVVAVEDDDDVPLQCLSDLATSAPKTLTPHLQDIFTLCISTVGDKEKDESYRHSALEVMVSLCESAPNVMRKRGGNYIPLLVERCLHMMTELSDDTDEWLAQDNAEDEMEEENSGIGETSLDRVACALGGKSVLSHALHCITELLKSQDWKCRHTAIMALSTIGEGCRRQMEASIPDIVNNLVLPRLADPHPRVRYAACNAIGQMCTDFSPTVQKRCHASIVPALLGAMSELNTPRVAAHAGAAIVNFSEECPKAIMGGHLPAIMEKLEWVLEQTFQHLLENGKKIVLEQVITSIASVADAAQEQFIQFYAKLMPPLKYILQNANVDNLKMLRGKTIECVSLIGLAVGREVFAADANEVMQILLSTPGMNFEDNSDPQISYMISAWARICKILGEQFAQYLDAVMPAVLTAAEFKPDVTIVDDEEEKESDEEWNFISLGDDRSLGIKTAGLEDKVTACEMLVCYARELKTAFAPYVERVLQLMLPLMKFMFHDGVRSAAAECMPNLIACMRNNGEVYLRQMWATILPAYKEAIERETDRDVLGEQLSGLGECVENLGASIVTEAELEALYAIIHKQMLEFEKRRNERLRATKDEEPTAQDEEEEEQQNEIIEEETAVLSRISDLVHATFVIYGPKVLPLFNNVVMQFATLLQPNRPYQDRQWGICVFDDLIEYGGPEGSAHYKPVFLEPMLKALQDKYPEVCQASAYGFGVMALRGGALYTQECAQALAPLAACIAREGARSTEEDTSATENAISAVAKILKYNSAAVDVSGVVPAFLSWLPVWDDVDEVPHIYDYFCDLVESNSPLVLGDNNQGLPRLLQIILQTFAHAAFDLSDTEEAAGANNGVAGQQSEPQSETEKLTKVVRGRLVRIVKMLHANQQVFSAILQTLQLNSLQQQLLQKILTAQ